jgi:hypothetical protein
MYSLVFAADMYKTVFKANPLDPVRGTHYRDTILQPGGSRDEGISLEVCSCVYFLDSAAETIHAEVPWSCTRSRGVRGGVVRE